MRLIPDIERFGYLEHSESQSVEESDNKRKYKRISLTKRNQLLEKIFFENKKIKNVQNLFPFDFIKIVCYFMNIFLIIPLL